MYPNKKLYLNRLCLTSDALKNVKILSEMNWMWIDKWTKDLSHLINGIGDENTLQRSSCGIGHHAHELHREVHLAVTLRTRCTVTDCVLLAVLACTSADCPAPLVTLDDK